MTAIPTGVSLAGMATGPWTDAENNLIVADYFAMLGADLAGRFYNKAEHNRQLRSASGVPTRNWRIGSYFPLRKSTHNPSAINFAARTFLRRTLLDFTVIGRAVNEASRIEGMCKPLNTTVVISEDLAKSLPGVLVSLGRHELRGVSESKELFTLAA